MKIQKRARGSRAVSRQRCFCNKTVFQTGRGKDQLPPSLEDIEDLLTRSYHMPSEHRAEFFQCHGVDLISVHKYYSVVKALNGSMYSHKAQERESILMVIGWFHRLIVFYASLVLYWK
jgi:hypothetical protein